MNKYIQHSSNFMDRTIRTTVNLMELTRDKLYEVVPVTEHLYVDSMFVSLNTFAQECDENIKTLEADGNYIKELHKNIDDRDIVIKNLRKDLEGMQREVERLRELNNNQAWIIANNRTKRSDFHV